MKGLNPIPSKDTGCEQKATRSSLNSTFNQKNLQDSIVEAITQELHTKGLQDGKYARNHLPIPHTKLLARSFRQAQVEIAKAKERATIEPLPTNRASVDLDLLKVDMGLITGMSHLRERRPSQDSGAFYRDSTLIVAALSDGAGQAPLSQYGARFFAENAVDLVRKHLNEYHDTLLSPHLLSAVYCGLYERSVDLSRSIQLSPLDMHEKILTATLTLVVITPTESLVLSLSDGFIEKNGAVSEISETTDRSRKLDQFNIGPSISHAVYLDGSKVNEIKRIKRDAKDQASILLAALDDLHDESYALKVLSFTSTDLFLEQNTTLYTDGVRFCVGAHNLENVYFPLPELIKMYTSAQVEDLATICATQQFLHEVKTDESIKNLQHQSQKLRESAHDRRCAEIAEFSELLHHIVSTTEPLLTDLHDLKMMARRIISKYIPTANKFGAESESSIYTPLFDDVGYVTVSRR